MQGHKHRRSADLYSHFPPPANTRMRESAEFMRSATRAVSGFCYVRVSEINKMLLATRVATDIISGFRILGSRFYMNQHVHLHELYIIIIFCKIKHIRQIKIYTV